MQTVYVAAPIWEAKAPHLNPVDPSQPYIPAFEVGTLSDTMLLRIHPDDEIVCLNATELMLLGVWLNPTNRYGGGMKLIRIEYAHYTMKHHGPFTIKLYKGGYIQAWAVRFEMTEAQHDRFFLAMDEPHVPPRSQNLVFSRMHCKQ